MKPPFTQTIVKRNVTTNAFGSVVSIVGVDENLLGRFRYITEIVDTHQNREQVDADAMAWFDPDAGVVKGDVLYYDNETFRVEKVTLARDWTPNVQFIKCILNRFALIS